ncbi:MAG: DUF6054 family protein [Promethearchaeota archaeon]
MEYGIIKSRQNLKIVLDEFINYFQPNFVYASTDGNVKAYILEKFYFRVESNLSTTVIFDFNRSEINIVVSGGSHGLFGITWGSERNMMKKMIEFFDNI